jgi:hypothetical protein
MTVWTLAQVGADKAIEAAAQQGGWIAVSLVVLMIAVVGLLVWLVKTWITQASSRESEALKQAIDREIRRDKRIDDLENYIRTTLKDSTDKATTAMLTLNVSAAENVKVITELIATLHTTRPCFAIGESQDKIVATIADRVCDRIILKTRDSGT